MTKVPVPVLLKPTPAAVDIATPPMSNFLPEKTFIVATVPLVTRVPDGEEYVKFSSARIPPIEMPAAPLPVPFTVAKTAVLPVTNAEVKGPALVAAHFDAVRAFVVE